MTLCGDQVLWSHESNHRHSTTCRCMYSWSLLTSSKSTMAESSSLLLWSTYLSAIDPLSPCSLWVMVSPPVRDSQRNYENQTHVYRMWCNHGYRKMSWPCTCMCVPSLAVVSISCSQPPFAPAGRPSSLWPGWGLSAWVELLCESGGYRMWKENHTLLTADLIWKWRNQTSWVWDIHCVENAQSTLYARLYIPQPPFL